ncbi:hypothetical protein, partial [Aeromonas salmonicida]
EPDFHFTIPIMRLTESAEQIIGQRPGLHFTLPITPMPDGSDELLTPLSADNRVRWSQISISRYR